MNWELLVVGIFLAIALKSIADALLIVAQRMQAHTEIVRLATLPRPHLKAVSESVGAAGRHPTSDHARPSPTGGPRWEHPK